jgi:hypothetical protein
MTSPAAWVARDPAHTDSYDRLPISSSADGRHWTTPQVIARGPHHETLSGLQIATAADGGGWAMYVHAHVDSGCFLQNPADPTGSASIAYGGVHVNGLELRPDAPGTAIVIVHANAYLAQFDAAFDLHPSQRITGSALPGAIAGGPGGYALQATGPTPSPSAAPR